MKTLVITPENDKDLKFLKTLLTKLGYPVQELSDQEAEDLGLLQAMVRERKQNYISEEDIRKALKWRSFYKDVNKLKDKLNMIIDEVKSAPSLKNLNYVEKLKGSSDAYKVRLGEYRLGLFVEKEQVIFSRFLHRKDIYKKFLWERNNQLTNHFRKGGQVWVLKRFGKTFKTSSPNHRKNKLNTGLKCCPISS